MSFRSITLLALALVLPAEYLVKRKELSTDDKRRILFRAIGTGLSAAAAWGMASAVDNGMTRAWTRPLQIVWGIALLGAVFIAAFLYAQAVAVALGMELPFLRDPAESPASRRAFRWTMIVGTALVTLVLLVHVNPTLRARLAMAGIGLFCVLLAVLRPSGFWDAPRARVWRAILGDRILMLIYVCIGVGIIILALTAPLE